MEFSSNRVGVISLGNDFPENALETCLQEHYRTARFRDAYQVSLADGEIWLFDYGIVVFWGVSEDQRQALLARLRPLLSDGAPETHQEDFYFALEAEQHAIRQDTFHLSGNDPLTRLAVSHALAQSLQLDLFEQRAQQSILDTSDIPASLSRTGRVPFNRRAIARMRGQLFEAKSDIILHYGLLDTPEFFWEYPEYEALYNLAVRYLDIRPRAELLSRKLETIHELLEMLADEQKHRHSSFLEWLIILLIALDIVLITVEKLIFPS